MSLQIEENIKPLPDDFNWGAGWRALRIWRELRDDGEFLYAFLVKKFGDNDYGTKREDELWIGREIEYIKGRDWQRDPHKPDFGKRVDVESDEVIEEIWNHQKGRYETVKTPVNAMKRYRYLHKADNPEIAKQYKTLIGSVGSTNTKLFFVYNNGSRIVTIENQKDFFEHTVAELKERETEGNSLFNKTADRKKKGTSNPDDGNDI